MGVNVYREKETSFGFATQKKKLGFSTNPRTRPVILAQLEEEIRNDATQLKDVRLINECKNFVVVDGKPQAARGSNDDYVFSRAIAGEVRKHHPYKPDYYRTASSYKWEGEYTRTRAKRRDWGKYSSKYGERIAA
jgi:hypothetical protein